jgi:O-antigen/teichoic acid export membrane protein/GT2 family glycosyltransferase
VKTTAPTLAERIRGPRGGTPAAGSWADALRRPGRSTLAFVAATLFVNIGNYGFHVAVSRILGPSEYSALAALLGIVLVLGVPAGMLQAAVVSRTASAGVRGTLDPAASAAGTIKALLPPILLLGVLLLAALTPALVVFLNVTWRSAAVLAPYAMVSAIAAVVGGTLQGTLRFTVVSAMLALGVVLRLVGGITLTEAGFGAGGAIAATLIASMATCAVGLRALGVTRHAWRARAVRLGELKSGMRASLFALASFWAFAEIDLVLARHFLPHREAGYYSSAGLLARAPLFLAASVATLAFPRFVAAEGHERIRLLRRALVTAGAATALGVIGLTVLRVPLVEIAFGEKYKPATSLVPILALAMGFVAITGVTTYFHLALRSRAYLITFAGIAVMAVTIVFFHADGHQIAYCTLGCAIAVALGQLATARSLLRWQAPGLPDEQPAPDPSLELSLVLPCHNAAHGIERLLTDLERCLSETRYEILVVSDGSTDDTASLARASTDPHVRVLDYPERVGKGHALRTGFRETRGTYVAFLDADGDIAPETLLPFLSLMRVYRPDIVIGSKRHPLSQVEYPPLRRLMSWGYHMLTRVAFRIEVHDTQTGVKMLRRDVLADVLPGMLEKRFAFDLELLVAARAAGYKRIFEAPVTIAYRFASTVRPSTVREILRDTAAVWYRHVLLNQYRPADAPPPPEISRARALTAAAEES